MSKLSEIEVSHLLSMLKPQKRKKKIPVGENILIDLIPDSYQEVIDAKKAKEQWTTIFCGVVIFSVIVCGLFFGYNYTIEQKLSEQQTEQESLDLEIAKHAEVNQAMQSKKTASSLLAQSMGNEIDWNKMIDDIESSLPSGTQISSLSVTDGGTEKSKVSSSVLVNLTSDDTLGYSDSLKAVENIPGVTATEIGGLSLDSNGGYTYQMSFTFDTSVLTNRYSTGE